MALVVGSGTDAVVGSGTDAESTTLALTLAGLTEADFSRLRVCYDVPGHRGPHVSATQLIEAVMKTGQADASHAWSRLKSEGFLNMSGRHVETHRFRGQRGGRPSEVVDIPTALQIIMVLPGRTAAKVRVKASVLLTCFLGGDVTLVGEVYGMNELQAYLREHHPEHPLCAFRQAVEVGQTSQDASGALSIEATVVKALEAVLPRMMAATLDQQAQHHGVLEITRSNHSEAERHLLSIGTKVTDGHLRLIAIEGWSLHLSVFLSERGVQADIIRRLTPTFSAEVKRRKFDRYAGEGPFWIAVSQGSWRPFYTEADRDLIDEVFEDPLTKQNIEAIRASSQPPRTLPPANNGRLRRRAGPYSRALRCTSSGAVTRLDTFFTRRVGDS